VGQAAGSAIYRMNVMPELRVGAWHASYSRKDTFKNVNSSKVRSYKLSLSIWSLSTTYHKPSLAVVFH